MSTWSRCLRSGVVSMALAASAFGITINNTNDPGYITGNSNYTGVVKILFNSVSQPGTFICSGSLISPGLILTAGHCADGAQNWTVTFETAGGTTIIDAAGAYLHPLFDDRPAPLSQLDEYDLAILALAQYAPSDAEIYDLNPGLVGVFTNSIIDLVGYGLGGNPTVGHLGTGTRRHAVNTIDGIIGTLNGVPTPDAPFFMTHNFSETPSNFGLLNGGDSGGPAFFQNRLVGVASFGNLPTPNAQCAPNCPFPDLNYLTGHATLFDGSTLQWLATIPEPGTWTLVAAGLLFAFRKVRRRPVV